MSAAAVDAAADRRPWYHEHSKVESGWIPTLPLPWLRVATGGEWEGGSSRRPCDTAPFLSTFSHARAGSLADASCKGSAKAAAAPGVAEHWLGRLLPSGLPFPEVRKTV